MQKPQSSFQKTRTIGNYVITKNLGEGTFGKVKLAIHSVTGQKVAIKILQKSKIVDIADVQRVTRQIHILKIIRHPNLIQLYEIIETPKQLFLIMEYVSEGELFQHIVKKKKLKQNEACSFFRQLIDGVQYLHQQGIVHRDLKPQNLLIDFNQRLKIVDFGLSNTYKKRELLKTACGSPCYAAPQMIAGKKYEGLTADIWSCGVILFAMICGYLPFQDPNTACLYKKITSGEYIIPKFVSPFARQFLKSLLTTDPEKRIKIGEIKRHAWYRQPVELQFNLTRGIKVGLDCIPVDPQVLQQVCKNSEQNCNNEQIKKLIVSNRHNHMVTLYYLLLKKKLKNGDYSIFDISSPNFDFKLLKTDQSSHESEYQRKGQQDLQQIELDRITTASGHRTFKTFSKNNSIRATNASQSPDITLHNFYSNKSKEKNKNIGHHHYNSQQNDQNRSQNIQSVLKYLPNQPPNNKRKIYFQAPTKAILSNSFDLKTIKTINNPEIKTQRLFQNSLKASVNQEKNSFHLSPLQDVDEKKQALKRFFHQERNNIHSIRQAGVLRTSMNQRKPIQMSKKLQDKYPLRESLHSREDFGDERYQSLDVTQRNKCQRQKYRKGSQMNTLGLMNRTFMSTTKNDIPKTLRDKIKNQTERTRSLMNNTITAGFSKRKIPNRQNNLLQSHKPYY